MNTEKIIEALNALAVKLGTTAEFLWGVLVRQAFVSGISDLVFYGAVVIALIVGIKLTKKFYVTSQSFDKFDDKRTGFMFASVFSTVIPVILVIDSLFFIGDTITKFANPEYWALQQLMEIFK